jgi:hypothetical protein
MRRHGKNKVALEGIIRKVNSIRNMSRKTEE